MEGDDAPQAPTVTPYPALDYIDVAATTSTTIIMTLQLTKPGGGL